MKVASVFLISTAAALAISATAPASAPVLSSPTKSATRSASQIHAVGRPAQVEFFGATGPKEGYSGVTVRRSGKLVDGGWFADLYPNAKFRHSLDAEEESGSYTTSFYVDTNMGPGPALAIPSIGCRVLDANGQQISENTARNQSTITCSYTQP